MSSVSTATTASAIGQQPLPKGFQVKSSLGKRCDRPLEGFGCMAGRAIQNTPSDIYSFAIVAIFAWTGKTVFFSDEANHAPPGEQAELILRRHLSFFASEMDDFEGFIAYHGRDDNPFVKRLKELLCTFSEEDTRLPFGRWSAG